MHKTNSTTIKGSLDDIFLLAADLPKWPEFLPHYRSNDYISKMSWGGIIRMQAMRGFIPVKWISRFEVDPDRRELRFEHYKAALNMTKGMKVLWTFEQTDAEHVRVEISHDLNLRWPVIGGLVADYLVGWFFINYIATRTLAGVKRKIESES